MAKKAKARKPARAKTAPKAKRVVAKKARASRARAASRGTSARASGKSRAALKASAGSARKSSKAAKSKVRKVASKRRTARIDPLNRAQYGAISCMLMVKDVHRAMKYYADAFGFVARGILSGPAGDPIHAEMRARDTTLMLGPEMPEQGAFSPQTLGGTPSTLYFLVEDVDAITDRAVSAGGMLVVPTNDAFWGDRYSMVIDPEGHKWMIATHIAEPTLDQMQAAIQAMSGDAGAGMLKADDGDRRSKG